MVGPGSSIEGHDETGTAPPPLLGEHTDEILTELGHDASAIERLRREGVIR